jgi:hypothetical protein
VHQQADQPAVEGARAARCTVVQPANYLLYALKFAAHDGYPAYGESLVGQVIDRAFGVV